MRFDTEAEIDEFLNSFEAGTIPKNEWTHQAHVAIAGVYVWRDPESALPQMRFGILSLNRSHGTLNNAASGYHETLTVFWVAIVSEFCRNQKASGRLAAINAMMETLPAGLFKEFYGFDVIKSRRARARWIEPDLRPLPEDDLS